MDKKKIAFIILLIINISVFAQVYVDSCFSSIKISKHFRDNDKIASPSIKGKNYSMAYWNGNNWISSGDYLKLDFLEKHPLIHNAPDSSGGLRLLYLGFAFEEGGDWNNKLTPEYIAFKICGNFIQGVKYTFNFTYLTNGWDDSQEIKGFAPLIFTNTKPSLDGLHYCGRLPEAGADWVKGGITFTATKMQSGDHWLIIHPGYGDHAGMLLSPCAFPFVVRIDSTSSNNDTLGPTENSEDFTKLLESGKIILNKISFSENEYQLSASSFAELDSLAFFLKMNPTLRVVVVGFTDDIGDENANQKLSELRAKAVYDYLILKNISITNISYLGRGETGAIVPNTTSENRMKNRRVEIQLLK